MEGKLLSLPSEDEEDTPIMFNLTPETHRTQISDDEFLQNSMSTMTRQVAEDRERKIEQRGTLYETYENPSIVSKGNSTTSFEQLGLTPRFESPIPVGCEPGRTNEITDSCSDKATSVSDCLSKQALVDLIDERLKKLISASQFSDTIPVSNVRVDPMDQQTGEDEDKSPKENWNDFVRKMAACLNIPCEEKDNTETEDKSYMSEHLLPSKEADTVNLPLEGSIIQALKEVDKEWTEKQRIRQFRSRDVKKYTVSESHYEAFCRAPLLDMNVEEGIMTGKNKSSSSIDRLTTNTDACLKKLDEGARLLIKQISYGALMTSYLDKIKTTKEQQEIIKNLSDLFYAMTDVTGRIALNSVTSRRSLKLRDLRFKHKATGIKLMRLPTLGPNIFGGRFFEVLHGSADNLRDAKETQQVSFKNPVSTKRKQFSYSGYRGEDSSQPEIKRMRIEASSNKGRKISYTGPQGNKPDKSRFRKGAGFNPSNQ